MRIVIQRVTEASVKVEDRIIGSIGKGALVLFGVHKDDAASKIPWLSQKTHQPSLF